MGLCFNIGMPFVAKKKKGGRATAESPESPESPESDEQWGVGFDPDMDSAQELCWMFLCGRDLKKNITRIGIDQKKIRSKFSPQVFLWCFLFVQTAWLSTAKKKGAFFGTQPRDMADICWHGLAKHGEWWEESSGMLRFEGITCQYSITHDGSMVLVYMLKFGVYWWDPWHTIYSSTVRIRHGIQYNYITILFGPSGSLNLSYFNGKDFPRSSWGCPTDHRPFQLSWPSPPIVLT